MKEYVAAPVDLLCIPAWVVQQKFVGVVVDHRSDYPSCSLEAASYSLRRSGANICRSSIYWEVLPACTFGVDAFAEGTWANIFTWGIESEQVKKERPSPWRQTLFRPAAVGCRNIDLNNKKVSKINSCERRVLVQNCRLLAERLWNLLDTKMSKMLYAIKIKLRSNDRFQEHPWSKNTCQNVKKGTSSFATQAFSYGSFAQAQEV